MISMEARELRLNNYVLCQWTEEEFSDEQNDYIDIKKEKVGKVVQLDSTGTQNYSIYVETKSDEGVPIEDFDQILPIPLTQDWLIRFGFTKIPKMRDDLVFRKGFFEYWLEDSDMYFKDVVIEEDIKYAHQLQNLYLSIVGEELTLKTE